MPFGESAAVYQTARQAYPQAVFDYIQTQLSETNKKSLLDLGCGTGIATRALQQLGFSKITGCDVDADMLIEARQHGDTTIEYHCSPAHHLPFSPEAFDVITSFGAFHWFCDTASVTEIKRILKSSGIFFIINKNDVSNFRREVIDIAARYTVLKQAHQKADYFPNAILTQHHFKDVQKTSFQVSEKYDLVQLAALVQSMQFWSHIEPEIKPELLKALHDHFEKQLHNGYYERFISVDLVWGIKA